MNFQDKGYPFGDKSPEEFAIFSIHASRIFVKVIVAWIFLQTVTKGSHLRKMRGESASTSLQVSRHFYSFKGNNMDWK